MEAAQGGRQEPVQVAAPQERACEGVGGDNEGGPVPAGEAQPEPGAEQECPSSSDEDEEEAWLDGADPEAVLRAVRDNWKFACVIQFCRMFAGPLKLRHFSANTLEGAVVAPAHHAVFLGELLYKLLRPDALLPFYERDAEGWERLLHAKLAAQWQEHFGKNPLRRRTFFELSPVTRVNLVYAICEWRVHECAVVRDTIRWTVENPEYTSDALRHYPIGEDSKGNLYYYFSTHSEDCRLYKQEPPRRRKAKAKAKAKARRKGQRGKRGGQAATASAGASSSSKLGAVEDAAWSTQSTTLEELQDFDERLATSRNKCEKSLHEVISSQILPKLVETAMARKRAEERAMLIESLPKKRSSRIQVLARVREEEEKRREEREEEVREREEARLRDRERRRREKEAEQQALEEKERQAFAKRLEAAQRAQREERHRLRLERLAQAQAAAVGVAGSGTSGMVGGDDERDEGRGQGRANLYPPGWSPLETESTKVPRTPRTCTYRRQSNYAMLRAVAHGDPPACSRHKPRTGGANRAPHTPGLPSMGDYVHSSAEGLLPSHSAAPLNRGFGIQRQSVNTQEMEAQGIGHPMSALPQVRIDHRADAQMDRRADVQYQPHASSRQPLGQPMHRGVPGVHERPQYGPDAHESGAVHRQRVDHVPRYSSTVPPLVQHPIVVDPATNTQVQNSVQRPLSNDLQHQELVRQHLLRQIVQRLSPEQHAILASLPPHQQQQAMVSILQSYQAEQQKVMRQLQAKEQQQRALAPSWAATPASTSRSAPQAGLAHVPPQSGMGAPHPVRFSGAKRPAPVSTGTSLLGPGTTTLGTQLPLPPRVDPRSVGANGLAKVPHPTQFATRDAAPWRDPRPAQSVDDNSEPKDKLQGRPITPVHGKASVNGSHFVPSDQPVPGHSLGWPQVGRDIEEAASKNASASVHPQAPLFGEAQAPSQAVATQNADKQGLGTATASTGQDASSNGVVQPLCGSHHSKDESAPPL